MKLFCLPLCNNTNFHFVFRETPHRKPNLHAKEEVLERSQSIKNDERYEEDTHSKADQILNGAEKTLLQLQEEKALDKAKSRIDRRFNRKERLHDIFTPDTERAKMRQFIRGKKIELKKVLEDFERQRKEDFAPFEPIFRITELKKEIDNMTSKADSEEYKSLKKKLLKLSKDYDQAESYMREEFNKTKIS